MSSVYLHLYLIYAFVSALICRTSPRTMPGASFCAFNTFLSFFRTCFLFFFLFFNFPVYVTCNSCLHSHSKIFFFLITCSSFATPEKSKLKSENMQVPIDVLFISNYTVNSGIFMSVLSMDFAESWIIQRTLHIKKTYFLEMLHYKF